MVYVKLEAVEAGSIGIAMILNFFDKYGNEVIVDTSIFIDHNMNNRASETNFENLLSNGVEPPYYVGTAKGYYILKLPHNVSKISLKNWNNMTYGKSYNILFSMDNIDYTLIYTNDTNGNGEIVEYDISMWMTPSLIKSNNKYYTYEYNEFIEVEPTVENFKENFVDLSQLTTPTDKVVLTMEGGYELEDGKIYRKTINTNKYKRIIRGNIK